MTAFRTVLLSAAVALVVSITATSIVVSILGRTRTRRVMTTLRLPSERRAATSATREVLLAETGEDFEFDLPPSRESAVTVQFRIPFEAVEIELTAKCPDASLEFRAACCDEIPDEDDGWTWSATEEDGTTRLSLTRHAEDAFHSGPLFVELRAIQPYALDEDLVCTLRADVVLLATPRRVSAGVIVEGMTDTRSGHRADFDVDVPRGTRAMRIDLVDGDRDLDLLASAIGTPLDLNDAEWDARSPRARESLVITVDDELPLRSPGLLHFAVVDPSVYDAPVRFRFVVTLGSDPPAEALAIPTLATPSDPRERALAAVVEVVVDEGSGSGTIVREDGLVLTALHVLGGPARDGGAIAIALNLDSTRVTRDLFRAEVVASDEGLDVALLQITAGLHGQPLPEGYRFPACPVAFDAKLLPGDTLITVGFPEPAGTGRRSPVNLSRGVVSGFEPAKATTWIKTDAFMASGSSGGAGLDENYRLVGVPVTTVTESEGVGKLGFLVPVSALPRAWREMIER